MAIDKPIAWVTGAGGLIGNALLQAAPHWAPQWRVRGLTRPELDLCDFEAVRRRFAAEQPELVVHCAALSKSPACQAAPRLAWKINVECTAFLSELATDRQLIFLSTDLVFDGQKGQYTESDKPNPLSVYAETKTAAEQFVLSHPKHLVIRTSLNGGCSPTGDRGFNEQLRQAWVEGKILDLFTDEFRSPLPASVTAQAIWELAWPPHQPNRAGLFHVAGSERLSRYEIGLLLARRWPAFNPQIRAGSLRDYAGPPRPPDTSLNCDKVQSLLSFRLPGLGAWLEAHPHELF